MRYIRYWSIPERPPCASTGAVRRASQYLGRGSWHLLGFIEEVFQLTQERIFSRRHQKHQLGFLALAVNDFSIRPSDSDLLEPRRFLSNPSSDQVHTALFQFRHQMLLATDYPRDLNPKTFGEILSQFNFASGVGIVLDIDEVSIGRQANP